MPAFRLCRSFLVVVAVLVASGCASGGRRVGLPQMPSGSDAATSPLEGEWQLTGYELADGSTRRVTGFVRFDRFSNITLRAELAPDEPVARPPRTVVAAFTAKAQADGDSFTYAGQSATVGAEQLTDDSVRMAEWRHYTVTGDTLRVSARDASGRAAATLVFERRR